VAELLSAPAETGSEGRLARLEREVAEQQRVIDRLRRAVGDQDADSAAASDDSDGMANTRS
jgi:uncharacterized coiled-coil protein SlyX